jgi:hypothetical protein
MNDPQHRSRAPMSFSERSDGPETALRPVLSGAAMGLLLGFLALVVAWASAGAGHGEYVGARALFPIPMLSSLLGDGLGVLSIALALVQFPIYGGLLGWTRARKAYIPAAVMGLLHIVAAILCFGGALPHFS